MKRIRGVWAEKKIKIVFASFRSDIFKFGLPLKLNNFYRSDILKYVTYYVRKLNQQK